MSTGARAALLTFFLLILGGLAGTFPAYASEVSVRPFLIDETLEPRESVERVVTIKNDYPHRKAILFATVNEITIDAAGEIREFISPVMTDRTNTITSWIEVGRGRIEIMPDETAEVPLTLRVHPFAEPGEYHAFIGFVEAPNRPAAEAAALRGDAKGVVLKITITDLREENLKISSFGIDRFVTGDDNRVIDIVIENTGDFANVPTGEIIFYDSRGIEINSVPVNTEQTTVEPGETATLQANVPFGDKLGRFKANMTLDYGQSQRASLYDSTTFYMMPLQWILVIFAITLLGAIFVALLFRRVFLPEEDDGCADVAMYVRDGHDPEPKDHDIDLKHNA